MQAHVATMRPPQIWSTRLFTLVFISHPPWQMLMRKNAKEEQLYKCISQEEDEKLLLKIHASSCGNHVASTNLVGKAFHVGFYWPSAIADAKALVQCCEGCQFFTK